jgi:GGDEF domain-containing protein
MKRLQTTIFALFAWFFVLNNVERLFEQVNLASFVYVLAPALGLIVLSCPSFLRSRPVWYIPVSLASVLGLRFSLGYDLSGASLAFIVSETLATYFTMWLSAQLAKGIDEYQSAAATAICRHLVDRCQPFEEAQAEVVREVRRARECDRPMAVMALKADESCKQETLDRFSEEFQKRLLNQYVSARVAECLESQLRSHDLLTENKDEFLALLPEMNREEASQLAERMCREVYDELGINLRIGISMFPEDEVTAIGLIESAESEVQSMRSISKSASEQLYDEAPMRHSQTENDSHAKLRVG